MRHGVDGSDSPRGALACVTVSTAVTPRVGHLHAARCVSLSTVGVSFSLGAQGLLVRVPLRSDGSGLPHVERRLCSDSPTWSTCMRRLHVDGSDSPRVERQ
jgi:hypothetical protein